MNKGWIVTGILWFSIGAQFWLSWEAGKKRTFYIEAADKLSAAIDEAEDARDTFLAAAKEALDGCEDKRRFGTNVRFKPYSSR